MARWVLALAGLWILLGAATPDPLSHQPELPGLPTDLDAWLASSESQAASAYALIPDTEKRIRWQQPRVRTGIAVVYLHGFSATRQEIAPVPEMVADALGANLFETRLTGHGRLEGAMLDTTAEDWLDDAAEALAVGARIGERIVLIATSTGATLAVALADERRMRNVDSIVMISPNFGPKDKTGNWLTRPGGPILGRLLIGDSRRWQAHNELQERYWSTSYPTSTLVEVMRLVDRANSVPSRSCSQDILMFYSAEDEVVSPEAFLRAFDKLCAPRKQAIAVEDAEDPYHHVLAGRILSPGKTDDVVATIVEFVTRED